MPIIKLHPPKYSDADYVRGIVKGEESLQKMLYNEWCDYFETKSYNLFFNISKEDKEDARQDAFWTLFSKVKNGAIYEKDEKVMGRNGKPFSCNLMTYLMAVAVNMKRELVRKESKLKYWDDIFASAEVQTAISSSGEFMVTSEEQAMLEIIANSIAAMSKTSLRCYEILSMFYYKEKSLDEILDFYAQGDGGIKSKDALKTRKNKCMKTLREMANEQYGKYLNS